MLKAKTTTGRFKSPAEKVQTFVGNIENLPNWATTFCLSLKKENEDYKVTTLGGEIFFRIDNCTETGVIDMWGGSSKDMMMRWPARLVDDGEHAAVVDLVEGGLELDRGVLVDDFEGCAHVLPLVFPIPSAQ